MGPRQEESLLAAIAAAPTDDASRLVYADWLEEHGEAAMAEFLRLKCQLASTYTRLQALRYQLGAPAWVEQVQVRRSVVLQGFPPTPQCRNAVIRLLREHAGVSLDEARALVRQLPVTMVRNAPVAHAIRVHQEFAHVAMVTLAPA